jgi:hypothetical protein
MKILIELIELTGGVVLLFAIGWVFAHVGGYSRCYDEMMSDNVGQKIKESNTDDDVDMILTKVSNFH